MVSLLEHENVILNKVKTREMEKNNNLLEKNIYFDIMFEENEKQTLDFDQF
jgi:hypothetical protein